MKLANLIAGSCAVVLSGCYSLSETEYPEVSAEAVPQGKTVKVKLFDFRTGLYRYVDIPGHESMIPGGKDEETMVSQTKRVDASMVWGLQHTASGKLVSRTINELHRKGYVVDPKDPQFIIAVSFAGPRLPDHDVLRQVGYAIGTLFTAEKNEVTCTAKLTVYDSTKTKVLFSRDYEQNYSTTVWGPIPVGSPACHPMTTVDGATSWALTALCDRAVADATAYIAGQIK